MRNLLEITAGIILAVLLMPVIIVIALVWCLTVPAFGVGDLERE
jgi:hypothetical protein